MPLEGQHERLGSPLRGRDRRFLAALAALGALATGAGVYASSGKPPAAERCVLVTVPSTMGGARIRSCGAAAVRFCRSEAQHSRGIAEACRREHYPVTRRA
jgi:hypothetical protein